MLSLGVAAFFAAGYFTVGRGVDPARARELATALDLRIPFLDWSVFVYLLVFPASLLPLFVVRSQPLFRRTLLAYAAAIGISLVTFAAFPVTSFGLRVDPGTLDRAHFSPWVVAKLYEIDPPLNLFPSLHLSIAALAALAAWRARPAYGAASFCGAALIAGSICTVKQHFVVDAIGGLALAALIDAVLKRPSPRGSPTELAFGWRGPAAFFALVAFAYASLYAWFRLSG